MLAGVTTVASVFNSAPAPLPARPTPQARAVPSPDTEMVNVVTCPDQVVG
jgi:hypothetical protein